MEELVKKFIDSLIEQAKTEAAKLAKQKESEGHITVPQPLAEGAWINSKGDEFNVIIMLSPSQSTIGRQMGMTSLQLYTEYNGKFVMDLRQIPSDCTLSICGVVFEGIDAIKDYWRNQTYGSQPYIIERSLRFPCFDSSDYAYENRYFWNFLICHSKQDAEKKAKSMEQLEVVGGNSRLVSENLPADMRPMVYYEDDSTFMILAY